MAERLEPPAAARPTGIHPPRSFALFKPSRQAGGCGGLASDRASDLLADDDRRGARPPSLSRPLRDVPGGAAAEQGGEVAGALGRLRRRQLLGHGRAVLRVLDGSEDADGRGLVRATGPPSTSTNYTTVYDNGVWKTESSTSSTANTYRIINGRAALVTAVTDVTQTAANSTTTSQQIMSYAYNWQGQMVGATGSTSSSTTSRLPSSSTTAPAPWQGAMPPWPPLRTHRRFQRAHGRA